MFHGCTKYVKLQIQYIRKILEGNYKLIDQFASFLLKILKTWKAFQTTPWLNNDTNSKLRGEHTKEFDKNTHVICRKRKTLQDSSECENFCIALYAYEQTHTASFPLS